MVVASADVEPVGEWTSVAQSEHVVASACVHVATRYGPVAVLSADGAKWTAMHESVTEKLRGLQRGTMEVRVPSLRAIHNAVDEIRRSGARAVIVLADPTSTVVVASEFRQAQVEIVLVGGPWLAGFSWKDPNILEGLTYVAPYFPNSPTWERFARAFNDAYREPADLAAARGFDAATLLGAALSNEAERGILPEEARLVAGYLLRGTNVGLDVVRIQGGESALVGRMIVRD
ncbi:MAG: amino acid ABC transporter substrate-binding protein [Kofleriaceae bacterium]|nr:amino acid ABC transporter substrate-binding protein [Myxococcales bacterium]MCB9563157.1 amino acid ABC transporter substrate-binding protein [Kofleriaceae bacterium]